MKMPRELIGQTLLNQFRVDRFVASGGMATIYQVWDLQRSVPLAMKVLQPELADDPVFIARFQREASSLQRLVHPNIVPFYGLYRDQEINFLLVRYIDGPSLNEILRERRGVPMPLAEALVYFKALVSSLGYAHAQGIVHCDIKPANVLVDKGGLVYLTDFGIARYMDSAAVTSGSMGTPLYMAPEQVQGQHVSPQTDVYSLGVLLFELLTGRRPFQGDISSAKIENLSQSDRIRYQHVFDPPPDLRSINPRIPEAVSSVVLKALEKDPGMRYPTVRAMAEDISQAIGARLDSLPDRVRLAEGSQTQVEEIPPLQKDGFTPPNSPRDTVLPNRPAGEEKPHKAARSQSLQLRRITLIIAALVLVSTCGLAVGGLLRAASLGKIPDLAGQPRQTPTFAAAEPTRTEPVPDVLPSSTPTAVESDTPPAATTAPEFEDQPEGEIVIVQRSQGKDSLFLLDIASGAAAPLPGIPNAAADLSHAPQWSVDGSRLAWMSRYQGKMHIIAMDMAEQEPFQVPAGEGFRSVSSPSWLPSGERLSFWASGNEGSLIVTADGSTGVLLEKVVLPEYRNLFTWNPKNGLLAFARQSGSLYEVAISSSANAAGAVVESGGEEYAPAWSADGQWIAFQSDAGRERGQNEIWIARADGTGISRVTDSPPGIWSRAPTWSPDGRWIAYVSSLAGSAGADYGELFAVEISSGRVVQLTRTSGWVYDWRPAWRPQ